MSTVEDVEEIREATKADGPAIAALYRSLSPLTTRMRFSSSLPEARVDETAAVGPDVFGVVALDGDRLVGEARCCGADDEVPELAVTVADDRQHAGLGARLLRALRTAAADRGVERLSAVVRTDNTAMVRLLQRAGCAIVGPVGGGVVVFEVATDEGMPGWPARGRRRRVLVESGSLLDDEATAALRDAGFEVRRCFVATRDGRPCPLLRLDRCRLAQGADLVACLLPADSRDAPRLAARHAAAGRLAATSMVGWRERVFGLVR